MLVSQWLEGGFRLGDGIPLGVTLGLVLGAAGMVGLVRLRTTTYHRAKALRRERNRLVSAEVRRQARHRRSGH